MYSYLNNLLPRSFDNFLPAVNFVHSYNTRLSNLLYMSRFVEQVLGNFLLVIKAHYLLTR